MLYEVITPRRFVRIEPSDNVEMLQRTWADPLMMPTNRIDQVYGLVSLMERAHDRAPSLPESVPTLMSYGANDYVVPVEGVKRTAKVLPPHVRTVYYEKGYRITSYNVCYTKLLRRLPSVWSESPCRLRW